MPYEKEIVDLSFFSRRKKIKERERERNKEANVFLKKERANKEQTKKGKRKHYKEEKKGK